MSAASETPPEGPSEEFEPELCEYCDDGMVREQENSDQPVCSTCATTIDGTVLPFYDVDVGAKSNQQPHRRDSEDRPRYPNGSVALYGTLTDLPSD